MLVVPNAGRYALIALIAVLFTAPVVRAADDKVTVSVIAIVATDQNEKIDTKLVNIAMELQKLNPKLTGFHSPIETSKEVAINSKEKFELVEGQVVTITVEQAANQANKNILKVSPPTLGDITYETTCGKFFPIITEYKTKGGDILIIAIRVQPCREKK
jgi:hypothetical protein